jgi:hypothetical protein
MAQQGIVKSINRHGERVRAVVYQESADGSGRLDLLIPTVDSGSGQVSFEVARKCAHKVEYVSLDEDDSVLGAREAAHFNQGTDTGEVTQDVSEGNQASPQAAPEPAQETWQRLGFASRSAWKEAGKPQ